MDARRHPSRSRTLYAALALLTIIFGLASRRFAFLLPPWLAKNAGDALYATLIFWLVGLFAPHLPRGRVWLAATTFCVAIEFAKLAHPPWLDASRHTTAGALILGRGFHVSNLVCYVFGTLLGLALEIIIWRRAVGRAH